MWPLQKVVYGCLVLLGAMVGSFLTIVYLGIFVNPTIRENAREAERLVWVEKESNAELARQIARRAAQAEVDASEALYLWQIRTQQARLDGLEEALEKEKAENEASPGTCRPAVPRGLRDALDPIGRTEPRVDPTGAPRPLR